MPLVVLLLAMVVVVIALLVRLLAMVVVVIALLVRLLAMVVVVIALLVLRRAGGGGRERRGDPHRLAAARARRRGPVARRLSHLAVIDSSDQRTDVPPNSWRTSSAR